MDLQLPCLDGIEATRQIVAASSHVAVLTMFEDDNSVFAAIRAGARGYLVKGADHEAIRRAVDAVASGETILSPAVAAHLLEHFAHVAPAAPTPPQREHEVLELVARGLSNQDIGC